MKPDLEFIRKEEEKLQQVRHTGFFFGFFGFFTAEVKQMCFPVHERSLLFAPITSKFSIQLNETSYVY